VGCGAVLFALMLDDALGDGSEFGGSEIDPRPFNATWLHPVWPRHSRLHRYLCLVTISASLVWQCHTVSVPSIEHSR
jgi:hypothetical protein